MSGIEFTVIEAAEEASSVRWGLLTLHDVTIPTPNCLLYTHAGSVPHLTIDNVMRVIKKPHPLMMSVQSTYDFRSPLVSMKDGSLARFCGFPESFPVLLSLQDPLKKIRTGYNDKKGVCIWRRSGKVSLEPYHFSETVAICRPTVYQALTDGDTPEVSSKKRLSQSVQRSLDYLDACLREKEDKKILAGILASIQGGYDDASREFSTALTLQRDMDKVFGFVLDGFHLNGEDTANLLFTKVAPILTKLIEKLPEEKPRFMFGCFSPEVVYELVQSGVDCFDSSSACLATDMNRAFIFTLEDILSQVENGEGETPHYLDLSDTEIYRADMSVIFKNCKCYTCSNNFSRAYINHLIVTKELLASVLLQMHNLHHWLDYFRQMQKHPPGK